MAHFHLQLPSYVDLHAISGMEINTEIKTKLMTNSADAIKTEITLSRQELEIVIQFKYLGAIISKQGSKPEVLITAAQATSAMQNISS